MIIPNPYVLLTIESQLNPENYSDEQLRANYKAAFDVAVDEADFDVNEAAHAVDEAAHAVAFAAHASTFAAHAFAFASFYADLNVDHQLDKYFKLTGENKQDYIDAINKDNKQ